MVNKLKMAILGAAVCAALAGAALAAFHDRPAVQEQPRFILKSHSGNVAVYSDDGTELAVETDIAVSGLREVDRQMLESGIAADTYEEILGLLEDLSS